MRAMAGRRARERCIGSKAVMVSLDEIGIIVAGRNETDLTALRLDMMLNIRLVNEQGRLADDQQYCNDPVVETVYH